MPLIVICGFPSSGKTTVCNQLKEFMVQKNKKVVVVSENALVDEKKNEIFSGRLHKLYHTTLGHVRTCFYSLP